MFRTGATVVISWTVREKCWNEWKLPNHYEVSCAGATAERSDDRVENASQMFPAQMQHDCIARYPKLFMEFIASVGIKPNKVV